MYAYDEGAAEAAAVPVETIPEETDDGWTKHYHGEAGRGYWYHELSGESRCVDEVRFGRDVGSVNTRIILNVMEGLILLLKLTSNVYTMRAHSSLSPLCKGPQRHRRGTCTCGCTYGG